MMQPNPAQVIEGQRQDWNRVAGGWEKWDRFFERNMDLAAPIQNLLATLTAPQKSEAKQRIIQAVDLYQRGTGIALPMAVRFVTARKPL